MFLFKLTLASPAPTFFLSKLLIAESAMYREEIRYCDVPSSQRHTGRATRTHGTGTWLSAAMPECQAYFVHSHQSCTGWCARPRYMSPSVSLSLSVSAWESFDSDSPDWQTGSNINGSISRQFAMFPALPLTVTVTNVNNQRWWGRYVITGCPVSLQMAAPSLVKVSRNLKSLHLKPKKLY